METIIHVDVETLGHVPGVNPMIAIGAAAYKGDKEIGHFYHSISWEPGELGLSVDTNTYEWWQNYPEQYEEIMKSGRPVNLVIPEFANWCLNVKGEDGAVFAAWPATYDIPFIRWYLDLFCHQQVKREHLFEFCHTIDIRSYLACYLKTDYSKASRKLVPESWVSHVNITHIPLDDARWQAAVLNQILGVN